MPQRSGREADAAVIDVDPLRLKELFFTRRQRLREAADRAYLSLLPVQWLVSSALCLIQLSFHPQAACTRLLGIWTGLLLNSALHMAAAWLIIRRPGTALTLGAVATSQMLLFGFLLLALGGVFDSHSFAFVSLAFLTFYREWTVLVIVAAIDMTLQLWYGQVACTGADLSTALNVAPWLEFATWVSLECGVLAVVCVRGQQLLWTNARMAALLEMERAQSELEREQYRAVLESTSAIPWELDKRTGRCTYIGGQVKSQWGWDPSCFQQDGFFYQCLVPEDREEFIRAVEVAQASQDVTVQYRMTLGNGAVAHIRSFIRHAETRTRMSSVRGISIDITAQKKLELELQQAQKLESIGRLAAGVAHEINTPIQFVGDNCHFLQDSTRELTSLLKTYQRCLQQAVAGRIALPEALEQAQAAEQALDVSFLTENLPLAISRSLEGVDRVATIVRALKEFSHPNDDAPAAVDINAALMSTLTVCKNEYKYVADVETTFGDLPLVNCYIGALNQAFLNIIVNAAHAIAEANTGTDRRGLICIRTALETDDILVAIQDTGVGIPDGDHTKIFDPFFTTKEVGKEQDRVWQSQDRW